MKIAEYKKIRQKLIDIITEKYGNEKLDDTAVKNALLWSDINERDETEINDGIAAKRLALFNPWLKPVDQIQSEKYLPYSNSYLMLNEQHPPKKTVYILELEKTKGHGFLLTKEQLHMLQSENIDEIYVFAHMVRYDEDEIKELNSIKQQLSENKITVSCIASPADAAFHIDYTILNNFYIKGFQKPPKIIKMLIENKLPEEKEIVRLFKLPHWQQNVPGIAFDHLDQDYKLRPEASRAHSVLEILCALKPNGYWTPREFVLAQIKSHCENMLKAKVVFLKDSANIAKKEMVAKK